MLHLLPRIERLARRYAVHGDVEEAFSVAQLELVRAWDSYPGAFDCGVTRDTWAWRRVRTALVRAAIRAASEPIVRGSVAARFIERAVAPAELDTPIRLGMLPIHDRVSAAIFEGATNPSEIASLLGISISEARLRVREIRRKVLSCRSPVTSPTSVATT